MADAAPATPDPIAIIRSRRFLALLVLAGLVGLVVSFAAWGFLELVHQIQVGVFQGLPKDLGFSGTPRWWYLPVLAFAGLVTAFAIARLPGRVGHVPAYGLIIRQTQAMELPPVVLAARASMALPLVIGA